NITWPIIDPWDHRHNVLRSLSEKQPIQTWCLVDKSPEPRSLPVKTCSIFKNVGHTRAKHTCPSSPIASFLVPFERFLPVSVAKKPSRTTLAPKCLTDSFCPHLCVTVLTCWRNLVTSPPRIKRVICPFDVRVLCHACVSDFNIAL